MGNYNITSTPIGIGEYSIQKSNYGGTAELHINVKKTTNQAWCGEATLELDLFVGGGEEKHICFANLPCLPTARYAPVPVCATFC